MDSVLNLILLYYKVKRYLPTHGVKPEIDDCPGGQCVFSPEVIKRSYKDEVVYHVKIYTLWQNIKSILMTKTEIYKFFSS